MFDSFRTKITLWYVGVLALILISFAALTYFLVVRGLEKQTDNNLSEMSQNFRQSLNAEQSDEDETPNAEKVVSEVLGESRFRDYGFVVFDKNGDIVGSSLKDEKFIADLFKSQNNKTFSNFQNSDKKKFRVHSESVDISGEQYNLIVFYSLEDQNAFLKNLQIIFLFAIPITLLLAALGGYFLARRSLAPVAEMSAKAANIGATNLNERLPVKNKNDEIGTLAETFNLLLERLENSFEQQRRFMADASHELRTPLAIVRGESEVALSKNDRKTVEYRESLEIVNEEGKRLSQIVEDLFILARADAGQFQMRKTDFYLDELVNECCRAVRTLISQNDLKFNFQTENELLFFGDETLIRRLIMILLDNAIKYSSANGEIFVNCKKSGENYEITFQNNGEAIPQESQTKIFDRFYRTDKARARSNTENSSGAGLGLSIGKWIAEAHIGNLILVKSDELETIFKIILPVK